MIILKRNVVRNVHHSFLAPPPFKKSMPHLSRACSSAPIPTISPQEKKSFEKIKQAILTYKVGGKFWGKSLPRDFRNVLSLPAECELPLAQAALNCLRDTLSQDDILLLVPTLTARTQKLARNLKLPCAGADNLDPHALLATVKSVVAVTPTSGQLDVCMLAALQDKPVQLWERDSRPVQHLTASRVLTTISQETCYFNPFSGQETDCFSVIELLALWKHTLCTNRQLGACMGMSFWKRPQISHFLAKAPGKPRFFLSSRRALAACRSSGKSQVAVWATRLPTNVETTLKQANLHPVLVEDGFVRSIGLGSALQPPASIFLDRRGAYYDPEKPSDLEHILLSHHFSPPLLARASAILEYLRAKGISKYGRANSLPTTPTRSRERPTLLVPGQVADDLSVLRGGGKIQDNLSLLKAVRSAHPNAYIIYRPHPDVEGGYRKGALPDTVVLTLANEISRGGNITELLAHTDEVHTLTSLAGFEALIRKIPVTTYGAPFYAGWGLTHDKGSIPARRNRVLTLTELVAGALLLYPRYLDPVTKLPCTLEIVLKRFDQPNSWQPTYWMHLRKFQIVLHKMISTLCRSLLFYR